MIIEINNFGPIGKLKFDLEKDLHLIYGKNGLGKSYATYCLYCLLKSVKGRIVVRNYGGLPEGLQSVSTLVNDLDVGQIVSQTDTFLVDVNVSLASVFLDDFRKSLLNSFSSIENLKNRFSSEEFRLVLQLSESEKVTIFSLRGELNLNYSDSMIENVEFERTDSEDLRYLLKVGDRKIAAKDSLDLTYFYREEFNQKLSQIFGSLEAGVRDVYFLPASRSGLYQALNSLSPILAQLSSYRRELDEDKLTLPSLSEPISDYFLNLSSLDSNYVNAEFAETVDLFERQILKGRVRFDEREKKIYFDPLGIEMRLDLAESSSMVAELSPLIMFLKHIIGFKEPPHFHDTASIHTCNVLFIEEPEAHVHPEIQVLLMDFLSKLARGKLKIFITSHSNYMFNKLNNLILNEELDLDKIQAHNLEASEDGSTIESKLDSIDDGIIDANFQRVSVNLYNERMKIFEKDD